MIPNGITQCTPDPGRTGAPWTGFCGIAWSSLKVITSTLLKELASYLAPLPPWEDDRKLPPFDNTQSVIYETGPFFILAEFAVCYSVFCFFWGGDLLANLTTNKISRIWSVVVVMHEVGASFPPKRLCFEAVSPETSSPTAQRGGF